MTNEHRRRVQAAAAMILVLARANPQPSRRSGAEAERLFAALADGGQVKMPLGKTFFASHFGMVTDRFGVGWMVIVAPA